MTTANSKIDGVAVRALTDRVLQIGVGDDVRRLAGDLDQALSGIVVVGDKARAATHMLRQAYPNMIVIQQPMIYKIQIATVTAPFPFDAAPEDEEQGLFPLERTLDDYLDELRRNGSSCAMTPTGFLPPGAHRELTAIVKVTNALDRDDVILHLPLSYKWLASAADRGKLISAVARSKHPVAISLAHKSDPASQTGVVAGLHELVAAAGDKLALWHCDLGVLDALAHGALGGAIGVTSTWRHITDPGETAFSPTVTDQTPNVLLPDHQRYKKAQTMNRLWFANSAPPTCDCRICAGKSITRFDATDSAKLEAHRHNLTLVTATQQALLAANNRLLQWAEILADAETAHQSTRTATGVLSIKPEGALKQWIALNPVPAIDLVP